MVIAGLTPREAVRAVEARLSAAGCPDADYDARELFRVAAGRDARLSDRVLTTEEAEKLETLCTRREQREPLQYLCGIWSFLDFDLAVGPGVLCPRADTEVVAEAAAGMLAGVETPRVLDLCAGTGCLGLGVKRFCPAAQVTSLEKSPAAYRYLEQNAHLSPVLTITPVRGDLFTYWKSAPEGELDLIVSNPPYVASMDILTLDSSVRDYEPIWALDGGEDGYRFYKAIIKYWKSLLRPGGFLLFEVGEGQAATVKDMLSSAGFRAVGSRLDTLNIERVVIGKM